jgi:hypothetical protein
MPNKKPPVKLSCSQCGSEFERSAREYNYQIKLGTKHFFCKRGCAADWSSINQRAKKTKSKKCLTCNKTKPISEFSIHSIRSTSEVKFHAHCRSCTRTKSRKYYAEHPEQQKRVKTSRNEQREARRQFIWSYLSQNPCVDCGEADIRVLDFDHIRGVKRFNVSGQGRAFGMKALQEEIDKCVVRCANCHRKKTAEEEGWKKKNTTGL